MTVEPYTSGKIAQIVDYFENQGYQPVHLDDRQLDVRQLKAGARERCGDDRYEKGDPDLQPFLCGPSFFGGVEGRAAMYVAQTGRSFRDAYRWAAEEAWLKGYQPGTHIAEAHHVPDGVAEKYRPIYGCAAVVFHMDRLGVTPHEIEDLRVQHMVSVARLNGIHRAGLLAVNFRPYTTVVQNRQLYAVDADPLARMGISIETWVPIIREIGDAVLPNTGPKQLVVLK